MNPPPTPPGGTALPGLAEVRFSLPELLKEVELERNSAAFTTEKLDQVEIGKLFQKNRSRRAPRTRK
jgi:hypothetical protein